LSLKERYGREMVFWGGGCDAQHILPSATSDQVRAEVQRNMDVFKPNGGYVFNGIHNIQADVPPENIVALFDAAYEYGFYDHGVDIRSVSVNAKKGDVRTETK
jgi:uroporphyrinogen decarboxylase